MNSNLTECDSWSLGNEFQGSPLPDLGRQTYTNHLSPQLVDKVQAGTVHRDKPDKVSKRDYSSCRGG